MGAHDVVLHNIKRIASAIIMYLVFLLIISASLIFLHKLGKWLEMVFHSSPITDKASLSKQMKLVKSLRWPLNHPWIIFIISKKGWFVKHQTKKRPSFSPKFFCDKNRHASPSSAYTGNRRAVNASRSSNSAFSSLQFTSEVLYEQQLLLPTLRQQLGLAYHPCHRSYLLLRLPLMWWLDRGKTLEERPLSTEKGVSLPNPLSTKAVPTTLRPMMEWDLKEMGRPWKKDPFPRRKGSLSQTHSLPKPFPPHSVQDKFRF